MAFYAVVIARIIVPVRSCVAGIVPDRKFHLTTDVERLRQPQYKREPVRLLIASVYEIRRDLRELTHKCDTIRSHSYAETTAVFLVSLCGAMLCISAAYAVVRRLCVCLSAWVSVAFVYCVERSKETFSTIW